MVTLFSSDAVRSEKLVGVDTGVRTRLGDKSFVDAALFRYWYDDLSMQELGLPFTLNEPGPPHLILPVRNSSRSSATTAGAEIAFEWAPTGVWQVRGTYTWLHLNVDVEPVGIAVDEHPFEGDSPVHQLGLRALARTHPWSLTLNGRWVDVLTTAAIPAYASLDLRLARQFGLGLELAVSISDALQDGHREAVSNTVGAVPTRVPRAAHVSMTWRN